MTTKTWLGSVYNTHSQAEQVVDHSHEISMFQHGLQCITPRYTHIDRRPLLKLIGLHNTFWTVAKCVYFTTVSNTVFCVGLDLFMVNRCKTCSKFLVLPCVVSVVGLSGGSLLRYDGPSCVVWTHWSVLGRTEALWALLHHWTCRTLHRCHSTLCKNRLVGCWFAMLPIFFQPQNKFSVSS